jgi:hypothetical protein
MKKLIFTFSNDNQLFDIGNNNKILIIENVPNYYKEEICDIVEQNKLSYQELKILVESWDGTIEMVLLSDLINFYKKNSIKGLQN